ncbi:MAG TPA: DUF1192 domain-containing protein [Caulobacteraceae bacterium]|jgi:uncharacterized small protein (DUF1192 family)|nr:DUF1192 domain-containing protein [Caulobacteraceae bacterium]
MIEEMVAPRPVRGASLIELSREDLDLYAAGELEERIERLHGEIERTRTILDRKRAGRAAADALFSLKS